MIKTPALSTKKIFSSVFKESLKHYKEIISTVKPDKDLFLRVYTFL